MCAEIVPRNLSQKILNIPRHKFFDESPPGMSTWAPPRNFQFWVMMGFGKISRTIDHICIIDKNERLRHPKGSYRPFIMFVSFMVLSKDRWTFRNLEKWGNSRILGDSPQKKLIWVWWWFFAISQDPSMGYAWFWYRPGMRPKGLSWGI